MIRTPLTITVAAQAAARAAATIRKGRQPVPARLTRVKVSMQKAMIRKLMPAQALAMITRCSRLTYPAPASLSKGSPVHSSTNPAVGRMIQPNRSTGAVL